MEFSTTRLQQKAKLLAEEVKEQLTEKQGINEMEKNDERVGKRSGGHGNCTSD